MYFALDTLKTPALMKLLTSVLFVCMTLVACNKPDKAKPTDPIPVEKTRKELLMNGKWMLAHAFETGIDQKTHDTVTYTTEFHPCCRRGGRSVAAGGLGECRTRRTLSQPPRPPACAAAASGQRPAHATWPCHPREYCRTAPTYCWWT